MLGEELASKEREAIAEVRTRMVLAQYTGNAEGLQPLVNDLLQGKGTGKDIDPAKAITLANQVLGVENSLQNQQEADDRAAATAAKAAKTKQRQENESRIAADLMTFKLGQSDTPPNFEDIAKLARNGKISAGFANTFTAQLIDGKPIVEDKSLIVAITDKIERQDSTDPDDYLDLYDEVQEAFINKKIDAGTFSKLYDRIESQRNSTISTEVGKRNSEYNFYKKRVHALFGFQESGLPIPGFVFDDQAARSRRANDAQIRFRELVDEDTNIAVKDIYDRIVEENQEADERQLPFMAFGSAFMDLYFPMIEGQSGKVLFEELASSRPLDYYEDAISRMSNGRDRRENFELLRRLRQHVAAMQKSKATLSTSEILSE